MHFAARDKCLQLQQQQSQQQPQQQRQMPFAVCENVEIVCIRSRRWKRSSERNGSKGTTTIRIAIANITMGSQVELSNCYCYYCCLTFHPRTTHSSLTPLQHLRLPPVMPYCPSLNNNVWLPASDSIIPSSISTRPHPLVVALRFMPGQNDSQSSFYSGSGSVCVAVCVGVNVCDNNVKRSNNNKINK